MIRHLSQAALLSFVSLSASGATVSVWNFNGVCSDCPGNGTGVLTVSQDTQNGPLSFAYSYSSPWISYAMDNASLSLAGAPFSGTTFSMPTGNTTLLLTQTVPITSTGGAGNPLAAGVHNMGDVFFFWHPSGTWNTGFTTMNTDFGVTGSSTFVQGPLNAPVPEPSSVVLMGLGAALTAWGLRRRQR